MFHKKFLIRYLFSSNFNFVHCHSIKYSDNYQDGEAFDEIAVPANFIAEWSVGKEEKSNFPGVEHFTCHWKAYFQEISGSEHTFVEEKRIT